MQKAEKRLIAADQQPTRLFHLIDLLHFVRDWASVGQLVKTGNEISQEGGLVL